MAYLELICKKIKEIVGVLLLKIYNFSIIGKKYNQSSVSDADREIQTLQIRLPPTIDSISPAQQNRTLVGPCSFARTKPFQIYIA